MHSQKNNISVTCNTHPPIVPLQIVILSIVFMYSRYPSLTTVWSVLLYNYRKLRPNLLGDEYRHLFQKVAEHMKDGEASATEVSFLANMLVVLLL